MNKTTIERPILFSSPMVQALLREHSPKTQTRRVINPQPPEGTERLAKIELMPPPSPAHIHDLVAHRLGRHGIEIELNPEYVALSERRIRDDQPLFAESRLAPEEISASEVEL